MYSPKDRSQEELNALVRALAWNDGFGCYTRAGFEKLIWPEIAEQARYIVYFDINDVHALNEKFGSYEPVNAMVRQALSIVRLTDYVAAQLHSGDEFLVCLIEVGSGEWEVGSGRNMRQEIDPRAMVERLEDALRRQGLSAMFAIVPVTSRDLQAVMKPAVELVCQQKKQRGVKR
jgi:GGDEF domain-containing protein